MIFFILAIGGTVLQFAKSRLTSVSFRLFTWIATWEMIRTEPILGNGVGTFKAIYPAYRRPEIIVLEAKSNTRILARPEVVVTDNNKATIVRGTEIGYAVGSANTGFSVAFRDAALKLEVTPTVIREPAATKPRP